MKAGRREQGALRFVLWAKVVFTLVWAGLLLILSAEWFVKLGMVDRPQPRVFTRLLGAAFVALLCGYLLGIRSLNAGRPPRDTVAVGIVSNGLASLMLIAHGVAGDYNGWGACAQAGMWVSAAATGLITLGLIAFRPR
jgi:hypothetical protein